MVYACSAPKFAAEGGSESRRASGELTKFGKIWKVQCRKLHQGRVMLKLVVVVIESWVLSADVGDGADGDGGDSDFGVVAEDSGLMLWKW